MLPAREIGDASSGSGLSWLPQSRDSARGFGDTWLSSSKGLVKDRFPLNLNEGIRGTGWSEYRELADGLGGGFDLTLARSISDDRVSLLSWKLRRRPPNMEDFPYKRKSN